MDAASDWAWPDCDEIKQAMHAIIEMLRIDVVVPKNGASLWECVFRVLLG
ncbi:MAG: hypothetical protein HOA81_05115 [Opitutales bacterium]|jgi:hypothetical protein|nr:hypothetical protein [Opitutales bacterium]